MQSLEKAVSEKTDSIRPRKTDTPGHIVLYQQAQYPQFDFFSPNGILKLREVTPSSLGQVMEDVRANYEGDQPLAIWNTMTEKSMLRAGRHRTKVHVIEFIPRQPVGPVKNLRRIRSLP